MAAYAAVFVGTLVGLYVLMHDTATDPASDSIALLIPLFLVDVLLMDALVVALDLTHRVMSDFDPRTKRERFDEDGTTLRLHHAVVNNAKLHPYAGELREHFVPPLKKGVRRRRKAGQMPVM